MLVQIHQYMDGKGRRVDERVLVSAEPGETYTRFVGYGQINIVNGSSVNIQFKIDADTVENAFGNFELAAQTAVQEFQKNQISNAKKIILPGPGSQAPHGPNNRLPHV